MVNNPFNKEGASKEAPPLEEIKGIVKEEIKELTREKTEKEKILEEYGGLPSNIPINHSYWRIP